MNSLQRLAFSVYEAGYRGVEILWVPISSSEEIFYGNNIKKLNKFFNYLLNEEGCSKKEFNIDIVPEVKNPEVNYSHNNIGLKTNKSNFLAFSGGIDSMASYCVMKEKTKKEPFCYFWNHGQAQSKYELEALEYAKQQEEIDIWEMNLTPKDLGCTKKNNLGWKLGDFKIPARNFVIATLPLNLINDKTKEINIGIGAYKGEMMDKNRDKSKKFFKITSELFSDYLNKEVNVYSPIADMNKSEEINLLMRKQVFLTKIRTCISDQKEPCGKCKPCFNLLVAIKNSNINENFTHYIKYYETLEKKLKKSSIYRQYRSKVNEYPRERRNEMKRAFGW